jgi:hypothetical protein
MKISVNASASEEHKRLLVRKDGRRGMQSNCVPDELHPVLVPVLPMSSTVRHRLLNEIPRGDGPVNLETPVGGDELAGVVPAQVVQESCHGVDFGVDDGAVGRPADDDGAEEPAAHDVAVSHVVRVGASIGLGGADQMGVWNCDACEDTSWAWISTS